MNITNDILYVGVNDHKIDLFEGQYKVLNGMSYNSYVILDEKIAVMDSVDKNFGDEWLKNVSNALSGKNPSYLVISHMEPDHSANIMKFLEKYPDTLLVGNAKTFIFLDQFFKNAKYNKVVVADGEELSLGKHKLKFIFAAMVHWPEVMVTYDCTDKILFSADAFGKFGALDIKDDWLDEARRYYIGIVGKYGVMTNNLLKKAKELDISIIAPLHGPILQDNLSYFVSKYETWATYQPEEDGILIAVSSIYGNTLNVTSILADGLREKGIKVELLDLARTDVSYAVSEAFKYRKLVLASSTYDGGIFPHMREFITKLVEKNFQGRKIALIENGTWAPMAAKTMKAMLEPCKNLEFVDKVVTIKSNTYNENDLKELLETL